MGPEGGGSARCAALAEVLTTLMPLVGRARDAEWGTGQLHAPHVARFFAEMHTVHAYPTDASVRLLTCCGEYADRVLCEYQQALRYFQRCKDARVELFGKEHPYVAKALFAMAAMYGRLDERGRGF